MQRAKHAERKQETRTKILIGAAAMRAGALHLPLEEIEAVLAHYVETGGSMELQAFVKTYERSAHGGSGATRRGDAKVETLDRTEDVFQ